MLQDHLATCPECRLFYEAMKSIHEELSTLIETYPRAGFNARVMRTLSMPRQLVWKKIALVFGSAWIISLGGFFFLPVGKGVNMLLTSIPALVRIMNNIQVVITTISHALAPFTKVSINPVYPLLGIGMSISLFYIFSKILHKEEQCKA